MTPTDMARPPYDPELAPGLELMRSVGWPLTMTAGMIGELRETIRNLTPTLDQLTADFGLTSRDLTIPGYQEAGHRGHDLSAPGP